MTGTDIRERVRARALAEGFDAVGFCEAALGGAAKRDLAGFLAAGHHGDMGWLAANSERRGDIATLWPEARSAVVVAQNYGPAGDPLAALERRDRGTVSVYAQGRDYHDVMKKKLRAVARWMHEALGCEVKLFVDTAPVMEKPLAQKGGIGWQGKHTNLVSREFGSWLFLGEILTTLALAPDPPENDRCGTCRRCLDICPTDAFPAPYRLDATRCISYLTIEHKGHIAQDSAPPSATGSMAATTASPSARGTSSRAARASPGCFRGRSSRAPRLAELAALDDAAFRALFSGSAIKRLGRDRFVRNVMIAIGNSGDPGLAETAEAALADASPLVRAMAVWALSRLLPADAFARLRARHRGREADAAVRAEWGG